MREADKKQQNKETNNNKAPKKLLQRKIVSKSSSNMGLSATLDRKIPSALTSEASFGRR